MRNDLALRGSGAILSGIDNSQVPGKIMKRTKNDVAQIAADLVVSEVRLEAGAFLGTSAMSHLGTLAAVAEAVVEMHPAAANGCAQVINAYGMGAADMIRRTVR
jgi:broad specificity polyphosphatase/5'/3'-nucleotidase SurE